MTSYLVTRNIVYNFIGQIVLFLLGILTAPYIIHTLGNNLYGILSIVTVVVGYFSVLDFGLGSAIIKYISEYHAQIDKENLEKVIGTALTAYIFIGVAGGILIFLFAQLFVSKILHIPPAMLPTAISVFYISSVGFFINMVLTVVNSIPTALQRMDISNGRNIIFGLISTLGVILLLAFGQSLIAVVLWGVLVSLIATIAFLSVIMKLLPKISLKPKFEKEMFVKLMKFGFFKFLSNVSGQVVFQFDKVLIGAFHPIAFVTFYAAPNVIVQKMLMVVLNIANAVFPAMSRAQTLEDSERVRDLYLRMAKFITLLILPITALLFVLSDKILSVWLGQDFALKSATTLKILALAYFLAAMSAPGVVAADAFGKPQMSALFAGISAAINFTAAIILIPRFGIEGAAMALLINFVAQVPVFLWVVQKKIIKISSLEVLRYAIIKPVLAGLVASLILAQIAGVLNQRVGLIIGAGIFGIIYLALNFIFGTIEERDKKAVVFLVSRVNMVFRRS